MAHWPDVDVSSTLAFSGRRAEDWLYSVPEGHRHEARLGVLRWDCPHSIAFSGRPMGLRWWKQLTPRFPDSTWRWNNGRSS